VLLHRYLDIDFAGTVLVEACAIDMEGAST
jgi:hypothetical protein